MIVPVYNVQQYLRRCIDSIQSQTYSELEIILVDDGSTDDSGIICDAYAEKDERIQVIHKKNGGLSSARNRGMSIAKGEYFCFVDSDDYIHPQFVEILLKTAQKTGSNIAVCGFKSVMENSNERSGLIEFDDLKIMSYSQNEKNDQLYINNLQTVVAWNKIYHRCLLMTLQYPEGRVHEDEFVIHHILDRVSKISYVACTLYYYMQRDNSITGHRTLSNMQDAYDALENRINFYQSKKNNRAQIQSTIILMNFLMKIYWDIDEYENAEKYRDGIVRKLKSLCKTKEVVRALNDEKFFQFWLFLYSPTLYQRYLDGKRMVYIKVIRKCVISLYHWKSNLKNEGENA